MKTRLVTVNQQRCLSQFGCLNFRVEFPRQTMALILISVYILSGF